MAELGHPLYLGEGRGGWVCARREHAALVLGPPRSGKTTSIVVPSVLAAAGPVVSTSTKRDVLDATLGARAQVGRCWVFDPSGSVSTPPGVGRLGWSPVTSGRHWDGAVTMARAMVAAGRAGSGLIDGTHWTERAEALLAPLLHAAALEERAMAEVVRWVNRRDASTAEMALARHGAELAGDSLAGVMATESREQSGIWSTASGVLAAYRSQAALDVASLPATDLRAFVGSADTIYVCAAARRQAQVAPLVVGLLEEVRAATYEAATDVGARPVPVLLALDELANVAPLPDLPAIVSEGGSQGLAVLACLQDLSQARARWGIAAEGFPTLFGAKVLLPGIGDVRTLEAISLVCGEIDVPIRSTSWSRAASGRRQWTVTWSTTRRRRLAVDELARGHPGAALLLDGDRPPAWLRLTPWHVSEPWRTVAAEGRTAFLGQLREPGSQRRAPVAHAREREGGAELELSLGR